MEEFITGVIEESRLDNLTEAQFRQFLKESIVARLQIARRGEPDIVKELNDFLNDNTRVDKVVQDYLDNP